MLKRQIKDVKKGFSDEYTNYNLLKDTLNTDYKLYYDFLRDTLNTDYKLYYDLLRDTLNTDNKIVQSCEHNLIYFYYWLEGMRCQNIFEAR